MKAKGRNKVIVAMSGGVDSSVAAALLKGAGFDVTGVFMKLHSRGNSFVAKKISQKIGIPFLVLDSKEDFKQTVINYFLEEYKKGRTPNPCVICNKEIKLGLLLEKALGMGADFIATGHYAIIKEQGQLYKLLKGKDKQKDQSYFLWQLNQKQLKRVLLPVGGYAKTEVRELARKLGLPTSRTKESQEVCFIETTTADFLRRCSKQKPGKIVAKSGKLVGMHKGLWFYTIGQRKGIGLSGGPYYVVEKDLKRNFLIVSRNKKDLARKYLLAKDVNWVSGKPPKLPLKAMARIRYNSSLTSVIIRKTAKSGRYRVVFVKPQSAVTPGQSVVFYKGRELLGGGVIC